MKRVVRNRRLTEEEAARYKAVREEVHAELSELVERHRRRMAALDEADALLRQVRVAREVMQGAFASRPGDDAFRTRGGEHRRLIF